MDFDHDDQITQEELMEWIQDEMFIDNEYFKSKSLQEWTEQVMSGDTNDDGYIDEKEMKDFLNSLPAGEKDKFKQSFRRKHKEVLDTALRKVYDALDINRDGQVTVSEVDFWYASSSFPFPFQSLSICFNVSTTPFTHSSNTSSLYHVTSSIFYNHTMIRHDVALASFLYFYNTIFFNSCLYRMRNEGSWKRFGEKNGKGGGLRKGARKKIIHNMDKDNDDLISFEEFREFFKTWTLR